MHFDLICWTLDPMRIERIGIHLSLLQEFWLPLMPLARPLPTSAHESSHISTTHQWRTIRQRTAARCLAGLLNHQRSLFSIAGGWFQPITSNHASLLRYHQINHVSVAVSVFPLSLPLYARAFLAYHTKLKRTPSPFEIFGCYFRYHSFSSRLKNIC